MGSTSDATAPSKGPEGLAKQALVHATGGTRKASMELAEVGIPVAAAKQ